MKVKVAKTAGFCWGVRRAIGMVLSLTNKENLPIYTYGPLIHNNQALQMLRLRGIEVKSHLNDLAGQTIVIRTHGISPQEREKVKNSGAKICDATCPKVAKVQAIIKKYVTQDYTILILGDKEHPEVQALLDFAQEKGRVINNVRESFEEIDPAGKICLVAQTTQNEEVFREIAKRVGEKVKDFKVFNTICSSTSDRQKEVRKLAKSVEAMVVVGGRESANTSRLAEISKSSGTPTIRVETEEELNPDWLRQFNCIGITAGASTPNWMIERVISLVESIRGKDESRLFTFLSFLWTFLFKSNLFLALGAGSLSYAACRMQAIEPSLIYHFIAGFYVFAMHLLNQFTDKKANRLNEPARVAFYEHYKFLLVTLGLCSSLGTLFLSILLGLRPFLVVLLASAFGLVYRIRIIPKFFGFRSLQELPASRDLFQSLAWTLIIAVLPPFSQNKGLGMDTLTAGLFSFILVFVRSVIFDIRDIQGDMIVGKETLPILIGKEKTKLLLTFLISILGLFIFFAGRNSWLDPVLSFLLIIPIFYLFLYLYLYHQRMVWRGLSFEFMVDASFLISGGITFLWFYLLMA
ncbi:MAG: 4-hydroxy-3-methylbut-2-enyl diphosphate reductase [Candidatus Edwardsbacteria bacterium]